MTAIARDDVRAPGLRIQTSGAGQGLMVRGRRRFEFTGPWDGVQAHGALVEISTVSKIR